MEYRIDNTKEMFLLGFAIFVDILELFLSVFGVGIFFAIISGFIQYGIIAVFFAMSGVNFLGTRKRALRFLGMGFLESIPIVEILPWFTYSVWKTIKESREEDEEKFKAQNKNPKRTTKIQTNVIRQRRG
jgi:hypothetical protein